MIAVTYSFASSQSIPTLGTVTILQSSGGEGVPVDTLIPWNTWPIRSTVASIFQAQLILPILQQTPHVDPGRFANHQSPGRASVSRCAKTILVHHLFLDQSEHLPRRRAVSSHHFSFADLCCQHPRLQHRTIRLFV